VQYILIVKEGIVSVGASGLFYSSDS
jgi:hypothetical protein